MNHFLNVLIKFEASTWWVKFLDMYLHLVLEISGEVGPPGIISSMEWWAIHREWRSFTGIQRSPTAPWTCHCAQEDEDCTRPESMIRQRLGHVRHDTTGGDVYLYCLPLSFPARSFWKDTWCLVLGCSSKKITAQQLLSCGFIVIRLCGSFGHFQNDYITFPAEWKEIKTQAGRQADCEVKDSFERSKKFFLNITNIHLWLFKITCIYFICYFLS